MIFYFIFKMLRILLVSLTINLIYARIIGKSSTCHCRYNIQKERDNAIKNNILLSNEFENLKKIISTNNCNIGFEMDYNSTINNNSIICKKCSNNYYRSYYNSTCLHCPEGFISNYKNTKCIISKLKKDIHTYCPVGTIIGNNPYAEYGKSCIKCDSNKKEYMSILNNEDKCNICPSGSIVKQNKCIKCPIGYYEKNNDCLECSERSYNDIEGSSICKKCDNYKSLSYYSIGSINCDNSILYELIDKINDNLIDTKMITYPIIHISQIGLSNLYNNRKFITDLGVLSSIPIITYAFIIY